MMEASVGGVIGKPITPFISFSLRNCASSPPSLGWRLACSPYRREGKWEG
jgi:hypothetical protein